MATLTIAGKTYELAPYKLRALREAAPHIDAINASVRAAGDVAADGGLAAMLENTEHIVAVLAIGLQKADASLTAEALDDMIGPEDMPALGTALRDVLAEAGLAPKGEATAPSEPAETAGA